MPKVLRQFKETGNTDYVIDATMLTQVTFSLLDNPYQLTCLSVGCKWDTFGLVLVTDNTPWNKNSYHFKEIGQ